MGTRTSSTSLLFSIKNKNFYKEKNPALNLCRCRFHVRPSSELRNLVDVAEFPEEEEQLLVELDLPGGMRQVRLDQRVVEQLSQTLQHEAQVLIP